MSKSTIERKNSCDVRQRERVGLIVIFGERVCVRLTVRKRGKNIDKQFEGKKILRCYKTHHLRFSVSCIYFF